MEISQILEQVDLLFDQNRAKEAEELLVSSLKQAKEEEDLFLCLQLLNELIGYYRQTSEKEKLLQVMEEALQTAEDLGLEGSIPYATTALNVANGYRSLGDLQNAEKYYGETEKIYAEEMPQDDIRVAGFYNNYSLCLQEKGDSVGAEQYLLKALAIVQACDAGFEIAVTYANLANTAVMGGRFTQAKEYAEKSVDCFEKRNVRDAHYCAALSVLGMCLYQEEDYAGAEKIFLECMDIVENSVGRNHQYERLKENMEQCREKLQELGDVTSQDDGVTGLSLCRAYYEEVVRPMLEKEFPEYLSRIAAGLAGEGSDCLGYDDAYSRDHDWGPDVCLWLTEETYQEIGERLNACYQALPGEFRGFARNTTLQGRGRRGVMTISAFYRRLTGAETYEKIDWSSVSDAALVAAVSGEVFADEEGIFTDFRSKLEAGFPEPAGFQRIAQQAALFSQTGQYNLVRMLERGDRLTADRMLCDCIGHAMRLQHYIFNVYPVHDKWLLRSTKALENGPELDELLQQLHDCLKLDRRQAVEKVQSVTEEMGSFFAQEMYERNLISDIEPYLDFHVQELLKKAELSCLSQEELVSRIAKLEFKAFDRVKNEGGRASCQNDWPTFSVMRKSQYLTWDRDMLLQYYYDFDRELSLGHNLITEKYGRMMESTAPEKYQEIAQHFPELTEEKKQIIEQIVVLQMTMMESFAKDHPKVAGNARSLHTYEDNIVNTSYETYLRGEISTYSDKMLQLYGRHVVRCAQEGINIARQTIENTARLYGYPGLKEFEDSIEE